jgi:thymidylate synthase ThyX
MPVKNDLPDKTFPMEFKWNEKPHTRFLPHLENIRVELIDYPDRDKLISYLPKYSLATWEDHPVTAYSYEEGEQCIYDLFTGKLLPTALETVGFTFLISNIDLVDVTHLIRHRSMSFSAHCTGDRDQRFDECLIKPSIMDDPDFLLRFTRIVNDAVQLYADMVDSKEISILDARTILPRSMTNHYYARVNLRDLIGFLHQRLDRQIQPESDNIVALRMLLEVAKVYPEIKYTVDLNKPDMWYVKTAQTNHSSNLYMPEIPRNDIFQYKEQWFIYKKQRSEMLGGMSFVNLWNKLVEELNEL